MDYDYVTDVVAGNKATRHGVKRGRKEEAARGVERSVRKPR